MNASKKSLVLAIAALMLGGCGFNTDNLLPDKQVDYKREKQAGSTLEIPPDLTANTIDNRAIGGLTTAGKNATTYSEYNQQRSGGGSSNLRQVSTVLPQIKGLELQRDGDRRWLLIDGDAETVWPKIVEYWQSNGILLIEEDPAAGVMRTGWIENRADVKSGIVTDFMRGFFSGMHDAGTRDQFRVRLERTANNQTELYLTHFGMEEVLLTNSSAEDEGSAFQHRPRDPELEAIILQNMVVFLGVAESEQLAETVQAEDGKQISSQITSTATEVMLLLNEPFSPSWRHVGLALDQLGFVVEDRDRTRGVYYVQYRDPERDQPEQGWLDKFAFWEGDDEPDHGPHYQIAVEEVGDVSLVTVNNAVGVRDNSSTAKRLLTLIQEQLK